MAAMSGARARHLALVCAALCACTADREAQSTTDSDGAADGDATTCRIHCPIGVKDP